MVLFKAASPPTWGIFPETAARPVIRYLFFCASLTFRLDNSEQQLPWAESMPGVYSGVDLFSSFNPPTTTLTMGDLQQPVQFPQSGVGPRDIGTVFP